MEEAFVKPGSWRAWVLAARPKTLAGAAVPVLIGLSLGWQALLATGTTVDVCPGLLGQKLVISLLCLLFAFVMQVDANFVNDYFDFMKGNDDETRLGPRRACAMGWVSARAMRRAIAVTTAVGCLVGLPLAFFGGPAMIVVGLACVIFCFLYTTHLSYLGLGDVLVLVFFGIVPVCAIYYLLTRQLTWEVFAGSVACGLVIDTLLMINNYRDIDNDTRAGKRTLAVRLGKEQSRKAYLLLAPAAWVVGLAYLSGGHVWACVLTLIYLFFHVGTYRRMVRIDHGKGLNAILGETARNMFIYGLLCSIGILLK